MEEVISYKKYVFILLLFRNTTLDTRCSLSFKVQDRLGPLSLCVIPGEFLPRGCLKSNDTLAIYLAEAISFFQFVLSTFLFFHNEPGSIVYLF
jgi:hypothetical protein